MDVILLAFDGLSKKDVDDKFVLKEFKQLPNYQELDLGQRPFYFTSELFTDLITGVNKDDHRIEGLEKYTHGRLNLTPHNIEKWLQKNMQPLFFKYRNGRNAFWELTLKSYRRKWEKGDIQTETLFDIYENATQNQIPTYDWRLADPFHHMKNEHDTVNRSIRHIEKEWTRSKKTFWQEMENKNWDKNQPQVYMHHFHYIDWLQHIYREQDNFDNLMQDHWWDAQEFMENVKEYCSKNDIELIVMSDHGLPERYIGHRPNAFIASTADILPENPEIWEVFYSLAHILEGEEENIGKKARSWYQDYQNMGRRRYPDRQ